jgi:hypothetical protein
MTNFDLWEAADRFQRTLERTGITAELERQGIQDGDTVTIANHEMVWGNQVDEDGAFVVADTGEDEDLEWLAADEERA